MESLPKEAPPIPAVRLHTQLSDSSNPALVRPFSILIGQR